MRRFAMGTREMERLSLDAVPIAAPSHDQELASIPHAVDATYPPPAGAFISTHRRR